MTEAIERFLELVRDLKNDLPNGHKRSQEYLICLLSQNISRVHIKPRKAGGNRWSVYLSKEVRRLNEGA